ncbi:hypothetical protein LCER1_G008659 [Lachnellula cervina]|uniref:Uncharacterized protein n=1 Tax=Lachnellula cervina TaxID=1316786 RepID=A0A7D8YRW0_9HELO|nr:hypothetical protein LCER1_G008659 [Lachnellula cervina]
MTTHLIPSRSLRKNFKLPLAFAFLNINTSTNTSTLYFRYLEVVPTFPSPRRPSRRYSEPPTISELPIQSLHLRYLFAPDPNGSLNTSRLPLVFSKATIPTTAPAAGSLVSDQDYSLRPNRDILNTRPPPLAAVHLAN